jgi:hypothetical protein
MKAIQLRSPLNLSYVSTDTSFTSLELSIFINSDVTAIDTTTTPDYFLLGEPIGLRLDFEIAELIRSKNNYTYREDFYDTRDTATYVLIRAVLLDDSGDEIEVKYNLIKVRDGYVERNDVQLLNSEISPDIRTYSNNVNALISSNQNDPFGGNDAYFADDNNDANKIEIRNITELVGLYTMSCFIKSTSIILFGGNVSSGLIKFNPSNGQVISTQGTVIAYDVFKIGEWYKISVVANMAVDTVFLIQDDQAGDPSGIFIFNPTIIKGNLLNFKPSEVLLQSNTTTFSSDNIEPKYMLDRKESVFYFSSFPDFTLGTRNFRITDFFINNPLMTSCIINTNRSIFFGNKNDISFFLIDTTILTPQKVICETKYTPVKLGFINKFGVIQDLVFFKKRVDTFNTSQQDFKANILRNGTYLPHTGQKQIISKTANAEVKLNTGFYPEDFNEVFKQLVYSTSYWINDEPAILKSTNFVFKTSVNDKLIDYAFDFEYANPDINDIT